MKRKDTINLIRLSVADGDYKTATRIYIENRISLGVFHKTCAEGERLREKLNGRKTKNVTFATL